MTNSATSIPCRKPLERRIVRPARRPFPLAFPRSPVTLSPCRSSLPPMLALWPRSPPKNAENVPQCSSASKSNASSSFKLRLSHRPARRQSRLHLHRIIRLNVRACVATWTKSTSSSVATSPPNLLTRKPLPDSLMPGARSTCSGADWPRCPIPGQSARNPPAGVRSLCPASRCRFRQIFGQIT